MVGAAALTPVAFGLSLGGWRRGMDRGYGIAGTLISGPAVLLSLVWVMLILAP